MKPKKAKVNKTDVFIKNNFSHGATKITKNNRRIKAFSLSGFVTSCETGLFRLYRTWLLKKYLKSGKVSMHYVCID